MSIVPVRLVLGADAQDALRENAATGNERASRLQRVFVAAQVAFAVMLLISAGLAVRTVMYLARVQVGFDPEHVVQATPSLPHDWRVKEKYLPAIVRIQDALRALPGTRSIAMRSSNALGSARAPATLTIVGDASAIPASSAPNTVLAVDSGYFNTLRVAVKRGRAFSAEDREASTPVAMINEWAASHWFAGRDPIGARLQIDSLPGASAIVTIVGIVKDNRAGRGGLLLADEGPELYRPFAQSPSAFPTFFVRLDGPIAPVLRSMRAELGEIVLGRPVSTTTMSDAIARQLDGARTTARQILAFSMVGLMLALIGVYAVLSYSVKRRTRELGIRRALGATASGVYGLIVRDALVVAVPGVLLGAAGALYTARFVAPLLHGTSAYDAVTFLAIAALVLATAVLAAMVPALRAARISPLTAIRTS